MHLSLSTALALSILAAPAFAQTAPATPMVAPAAAPAHYSTATTPIGDLLDDPAAKAVLVKYIPDTINNPQIDMARSMTLKDTQQYAPDTMSDATLAKIDADLAKLPPKK